MTEPVPGRKPVLALLMRLLWAAALVLPAFGAQAAVVFTNLYSFGSVQDTNGNALDGSNPVAGLVQGSDGYFYGTTQYGGTNGAGTVFKITANGALTSLYSFTGGNDGYIPEAGLVPGSDGYLYGTTTGGGAYGSHYGGYGTVFRISADGLLTTLYSFSGGNDGNFPQAGLFQGSDGCFYGTDQYGGTNGWGTLFKISSNGVLTTLYSFTGGSDGSFPQAGLVQGSDGYFYGTTSNGGTNVYYGTVFKISTNGVLTTLYSFTGGNDGASPQAGLVQGSDGYFYGTSEGAYRGPNSGTVFQISTNGALTTLYSFGDGGANPNVLVQGRDGYLYGTTAGMNGLRPELPWHSVPNQHQWGADHFVFIQSHRWSLSPCRASAGQRRQFLWHDTRRRHKRQLWHCFPASHCATTTTNTHSFRAIRDFGVADQ